MGTEIERRFRVNIDRLCPNGEDGKKLPQGRYYKQAYLAESTSPSIRIRLVGSSERAGSASEAWLTIKGPGTVERAEWEFPVKVNDAASIMALAQYGTIEKVRYVLMVMDTKWELDRFLGNNEGLWLAEVNLETPASPFDRPPWLGEEVTEDSRFTNARLAVGDRFWDKPRDLDAL